MGWALLKTALLFIATALAEILGCFLPYLWLCRNGPIWFLLPAAASLPLFVWLLTLHPAASGRVYAAYGGVYVATALIWLRLVDGVRLSAFDLIGAGVALVGMGIIVLGWGAMPRRRVSPATWQDGGQPGGGGHRQRGRLSSLCCGSRTAWDLAPNTMFRRSDANP
jgi:small multidrug resistance family-3 protein